MAYTDFSFYSDSFYGEVLTEDNAKKWLSLASDEIDAITFGRLIKAFPTNEIHAEKVKKAVCAIAETLYYIDLQKKAVMAQEADDGAYHGAVSSVSSGGESISYAQLGGSTSTYAAAAASETEQRKLIMNIASKYLAGVSDAEGTNLLFGGIR